MAKDPAERYQSVTELRQALEQVPATWTAAEAEAFWRQAEGALARGHGDEVADPRAGGG
jgi:hypothetical protein